MQISVYLPPDTGLIVCNFAIETPKEFACLARVSRCWNTICRDPLFQDRSPRHYEVEKCRRPASIPKQLYFEKLNKFFSWGACTWASKRNYSWDIRFSGKDILRFVKELAYNQGHTPKERYFLATHNVKDYYDPAHNVSTPVYSITYPPPGVVSDNVFRPAHAAHERRFGCDAPVTKTPDLAITPLKYFRTMSTFRAERDYSQSYPELFTQLYNAMYENRKTAFPEDPQLQTPRFGELAFYDEGGCTSTGAEKAAAVFQVFFRGNFNMGRDYLGNYIERN